MKRAFLPAGIFWFFFSLCISLWAEEKEAIVRIRKDGSVLCNGVFVPVKQLSDTLTKQGFGAGSRVLLISDPDASYSAGVAVLDVLKKPERDIAFAVNDDETDATKQKDSKPEHQQQMVNAGSLPKAVVGVDGKSGVFGDGKIYTLGVGETPVLHLQNDTGVPIVFITSNGDSTSGKALIKAEYILVDPLKKNDFNILVGFREMGLVFPGQIARSSFSYFAKPDEKFDVTIALSKLSHPKDPKSPREPLSPGRYRFWLELYKLKDIAMMAKSGLPSEPLVEIQVEIK